MAARQWTESQKAKQRELIQQWKPWQNTKGATTPEGKAISKMNALKHGKYTAAARQADREERQLIREFHQVFRELMEATQEYLDLANENIF